MHRVQKQSSIDKTIEKFHEEQEQKGSWLEQFLEVTKERQSLSATLHPADRPRNVRRNRRAAFLCVTQLQYHTEQRP